MRQHESHTVCARWRLAILIAVLAVAVIALAGVVAGCGSSDEVFIVVDYPSSAFTISFNRLWGQLAQAVGVDPEGARLEDFKLICDASGAIQTLDFQVVTRDRFFLQFVGTRGVKASWYGRRVPADEMLPVSSWDVPLDPVFGALDALGVKTLGQQLNGGAGGAPLSVLLEMRDQQGLGLVHAPQRALYYEGAGFVELGTDDYRREFGPTDAALIASLGKTSGSSTRFDNPVHFIVPR